MKDELIKELEKIDMKIFFIQYDVKRHQMELDKAINDVNELVERKKEIVETLKKLDINI